MRTVEPQPGWDGMSAVWSLVSQCCPPARLLVKVQTTKNPEKAGVDVGGQHQVWCPGVKENVMA